MVERFVKAGRCDVYVPEIVSDERVMARMIAERWKNLCWKVENIVQ